MRERGLQLGAVHLHLPLQIRKLVLLVGPHRRIQFQAAHDRDHFLAVGHAPRANPNWHRHARRRPEIRLAKSRPALGTNHASKEAVCIWTTRALRQRRVLL